MPVTAGGDYPVGVYATGHQPGSRRTAGAPHRRRAWPRPELEESLGYKIEIFKYYYFLFIIILSKGDC